MCSDSFFRFITFFLIGCFLFLSSFLLSFKSTANEYDEQVLRPNELGAVMILMYHDIRSPESEWSRTPENFEKDLQILYERQFRPVSLEAYLNGRMNVPQGKSPVVITFDDGTLGQFSIEKKGVEKVPSPRSAVGILEHFHEAHPDFSPAATFFVNGKYPFKEADTSAFKLNYIVTRGMDIGNHTTAHQNLRLIENESPEKIQAAIGGQASYLESLLSNHPEYRVRTFALCFGQRPRSPNLRKYLVSGTYRGRAYKNIGVLNVGASPAPSPFSRKFNPANLPRVRASELRTGGTGLYDWLRYFRKHPTRRYVSDGNPEIVTAPASAESEISEERLSGRKRIFY